ASRNATGTRPTTPPGSRPLPRNWWHGGCCSRRTWNARRRRRRTGRLHVTASSCRDLRATTLLRIDVPALSPWHPAAWQRRHHHSRQVQEATQPVGRGGNSGSVHEEGGLKSHQVPSNGKAPVSASCATRRPSARMSCASCAVQYAGCPVLAAKESSSFHSQ